MLKDNTTYDVNISFLDETKNPPADITEEIANEGDVHRIYVMTTGPMEIAVGSPDTDVFGSPVGIKSEWAPAGNGDGMVTIILRHYPNGGKEADDSASSPKASTDAEVSFILKVEP